MRVGIGYDVHQLKEGRRLIIGGVEIPHTKGLDGHSDADVLTHSIIDALLGAACKGDIGKLFPDNDDSYKDISSLVLLEKVREILKQNSYEIVNIDSIIIAQTPKMSEHINIMRKKISEILEIDIDNISIKATTTERLGFEGRCEGISAQAVAMIDKKS